MKIVEVVAAVIVSGDKILATQRGYGDFKGKWEFPGGKIESDESKEAALIREIREELDVEIRVDKYLMTVEYDYPKFHLIMYTYVSRVVDGSIDLLEHMDMKWLSIKDIDTVDWLEADLDIVSKLKKVFGNL